MAVTRRFESFLLQLAACMLAARAFAAMPNPITEAAIRDGRNGYNAGDYEAAIKAFTQAYTLQSDSEILYLLGKAYAMADSPLEAIDAFERYLSAAGPGVLPKRKVEIAAAIDGQKRRIGSLILEITPDDAKVVLDEAILEHNARSKPVPVRQGSHVVAASLDGYLSQARAVHVRGNKTETVTLALVPVKPPVYEGFLIVRCRLPGVSVTIDDRQVATTPVDEPILVQQGSHRLRLDRVGYQPQTTTVQVTRNKANQIECDMPVAKPLASSGQLELAFPETGALILVDGAAASKSNVLPSGVHSVEIRHYGFELWTRELRVDAGNVRRVNVVLAPTTAYLHDLEERAYHRRTWSYVLGATGLAIAGTALGIGLWNDGRYSDWQQKHSELANAYKASGPNAPTAAELEPKKNEANSQLRSIHAFDIVTAILGVSGGMLLGSGAVLYFTTPDPERQYGNPSGVWRTPQGVGMNVAW
jgi:hypothetical protein